VRRQHEPGRMLEGRAALDLFPRRHFPRVHRVPYLPEPAPAYGRQRPLPRHGRGQRVARPPERRREHLPRRRQVVPAVAPEERLEQLAVRRDRFRERVPRALRAVRRGHQLGQEQGDGADRQRGRNLGRGERPRRARREQRRPARRAPGGRRGAALGGLQQRLRGIGERREVAGPGAASRPPARCPAPARAAVPARHSGAARRRAARRPPGAGSARNASPPGADRR
jgi:hypothetical protein